MPPTSPPLNQTLPPLIIGTGTFSPAYVSDPSSPTSLPSNLIIQRALQQQSSLGLKPGFDTSPYYGPSESILGAALSASGAGRDSYFLATKIGRIAPQTFDYSPEWVRYSVYRSLERLLGGGTGKSSSAKYLDLVYAHDVEFVSPEETLAAVKELRRLRDEENGLVRYIGVSGFPVGKLCEVAEMILRETGEPLDAVLSYGHATVQNWGLMTKKKDEDDGDDDVLGRLEKAGVGCVLNASLLGMVLLTTRGVVAAEEEEGTNGEKKGGGRGGKEGEKEVPAPASQWHPASGELRKACKGLGKVAEAGGERLEAVALRWGMENWMREGERFGTYAGEDMAGRKKGRKVGVCVSGVSQVSELDELHELYRSVLDGESEDDGTVPADRREAALARKEKMQGLVGKMRAQLGDLVDTAWPSPMVGYKNTLKPEDMGKIPDDGIMAKYCMEN